MAASNPTRSAWLMSAIGTASRLPRLPVMPALLISVTLASVLGSNVTSQALRFCATGPGSPRSAGHWVSVAPAASAWACSLAFCWRAMPSTLWPGWLINWATRAAPRPRDEPVTMVRWFFMLTA